VAFQKSEAFLKHLKRNGKVFPVIRGVLNEDIFNEIEAFSKNSMLF
jgi:hypothetical protein